MLHFVNQPSQIQLGDVLKAKLAEGKYKHFVIVSAFAKNSGVLRMKEAIQSFRANGGSVDAFIGLDAHGTSYEAVCNLLTFVDKLYIVHDNNPVSTFHPKAYYLTDGLNTEWLALGSNNLTGGGLWTNTEWATIIDVKDSKGSDEIAYFEAFLNQIGVYESDQCEFARKINAESDLEELVADDLLRREVQLQIDAAQLRRRYTKTGKKSGANPFGTQGKVQIPRISGQQSAKRVTLKERKVEVTSVEPIVASDNSEKMWFETRKMTGGSRNILDLSMLGRLIEGTGNGSRYETDKEMTVLGSVVFFDVDPTNGDVEKSITINYDAKDYVGCTIKMHQDGKKPNGSWRIQLKGETDSGERLTNAEDGEWFIHKIIVLEKIRTDYYVMSVLPESELVTLKAESIFIARNGSSPSAKQYGLLNI